MYDLPEAAEATSALWRGLARHFRRAGLSDVPEALVSQPELPTHWLSPDLLFSQTCGYPLRHAVAGRVRVIATPCYSAFGCTGARYRSLLMVRQESKFHALPDLRGSRAAFNAPDSQSGYNALRCLIAPLARDGRFFGSVVETGSHAASLEAVVDGRADVAAVDCVSLALFACYGRPEVTGLRELCRTPSAPGLPYVTAGSVSDERLSRLRDGLLAAMRDPDLASVRESLLLTGVEVLPDTDYEEIDRMEKEALARGYHVLA